MNYIKRASIDIQGIDELKTDFITEDMRSRVLQRIEHLISSVQQMAQILTEASLLYETQRYNDPLRNLMILHKTLRTDQGEHAKRNLHMLDQCVLRLVQYTNIVPLAFFRAKTGRSLHAFQSLESRKDVLQFAKVLTDRTITMLEVGGIALPY